MQAEGGESAGEGLPCRFGKYTLLRKLATGGMAELFLAIQKSVAGFEKLIVIKRILPSMNQDHAFIEMLLHEARIAATLSHPNIVQIFDVGQVDGTYFIAMEHVHGEDLRSIVRQMKKQDVAEFPLEHALSIVLGHVRGPRLRARASAISTAPPLNIVHRDISPQNVVVTFTGDVKIVDFGIAKSDARMRGRHAERAAQRQGPVHVARAGARRGHRLAQRHLRGGRHALRADDGQAPLQGRERVRDAEAHLRRASIRCRRRCARGTRRSSRAS